MRWMKISRFLAIFACLLFFLCVAFGQQVPSPADIPTPSDAPQPQPGISDTGDVALGAPIEYGRLDYPKQALATHVQGAVVVKLLVGKNGKVKKSSVVSGDPLLADAAVRHAQMGVRFVLCKRKIDRGDHDCHNPFRNIEGRSTEYLSHVPSPQGLRPLGSSQSRERCYSSKSNLCAGS